MNGQTLERRQAAPENRRTRVRPEAIPAPARPRRRIESTWKAQAREALAREALARPVAAIETTSTLRQPKLWDVRVEPRSVSLLPPRAELARAESVRADRERTARTRTTPRTWEWWQVLAPIAITAGAVLQLAWAVGEAR